VLEYCALACGKYLILLCGAIPPKMDHVPDWNINWVQLKDEVLYVEKEVELVFLP
jgi:hypothetical protein